MTLDVLPPMAAILVLSHQPLVIQLIRIQGALEDPPLLSLPRRKVGPEQEPLQVSVLVVLGRQQIQDIAHGPPPHVHHIRRPERAPRPRRLGHPEHDDAPQVPQLRGARDARGVARDAPVQHGVADHAGAVALGVAELAQVRQPRFVGMEAQQLALVAQHLELVAGKVDRGPVDRRRGLPPRVHEGVAGPGLEEEAADRGGRGRGGGGGSAPLDVVLLGGREGRVGLHGEEERERARQDCGRDLGARKGALRGRNHELHVGVGAHRLELGELEQFHARGAGRRRVLGVVLEHFPGDAGEQLVTLVIEHAGKEQLQNVPLKAALQNLLFALEDDVLLLGGQDDFPNRGHCVKCVERLPAADLWEPDIDKCLAYAYFGLWPGIKERGRANIGGYFLDKEFQAVKQVCPDIFALKFCHTQREKLKKDWDSKVQSSHHNAAD
ncbi:hypothetical protein Pelo_10035 [Pelomyxa schiedti]|nr:hypothetical protein Pelo_10035 [Pelomyxa schiedti]